MNVGVLVCEEHEKQCDMAMLIMYNLRKVIVFLTLPSTNIII
jgi:hypothetical protein